ncbi:hypothetical protein [Marinomonas sp.]
MLTPLYCVALYSSTQCLIYPKNFNLEDALEAQGTDPQIPTDDQLRALQARCLVGRGKVKKALKKRLVVLVPDHWITVIDHKIEKLPKDVAPLAALSIAAESIFVPPEQISFAYRQHKHPEEGNFLKVFACPTSWCELLCEPFRVYSQSVWLMSYWQYQQAMKSAAPWRWFHRFKLAPYNPELETRQQLKVKLYSLLGLSLVLHLLGWIGLNWITPAQVVTTSNIQEAQEDRTSPSNNRHQLASVVVLAQNLPETMHLQTLEADFQHAHLEVTAPLTRLEELIKNKATEFPQWEWNIEFLHRHPSAYPNQQEVVDAKIVVKFLP